MAANSSRTHILTESAIMVALATVLSMLKIWEAPYGGSVTILSMAPIIVLSMRRGIKVGLFAGFAHSLIQLLLGLGTVAYVPTPMGIVVCILTDYILPFTLLGLGGLFRDVKFTGNSTTNLFIAAALGALLVTVLRYACHIVSGAVIWYALDLEWYADDPSHIVFQYGPWMFSAIYNGGYMIPEIIATVVGTPILTKALSKVNY
ncbi:MAG: energy-coupled thiamine transporter ThiT [Candidatus Faecousia sp.]|nr:energy-coupled thiamine transporter ThiT [Clostridiales bacterium]MDY6181682.1 energy-coupled thiamine transporter ThiT [Candidatus Faecousia sp.]